MASYLELFAKALDIVNSGKRIERSPYELAKIKGILAEERRREMGSTPKGASESEETKEAESKEEVSTTEGIKLGNALLRGDKYILNCTCGSWGHLCEAVEHECPTKCLRIVRG